MTCMWITSLFYLDIVCANWTPIEIFRHLRKGVVASLPRQQMSSFQQKLALKGSETSIEYFASVLKDVKDRGGWNTASALVRLSPTKKEYGHWPTSSVFARHKPCCKA